MTVKEFNTIEQLKKEAWMHLVMMIESGFMTDIEAMEQYNQICDRLSQGLA